MSSNIAQIETPDLDPNKDPNNPKWESTRISIQHYLDTKAISLRKLIAESGVNKTALNQFLNRTESNTRYDRVNVRLSSWIETFNRRVKVQAEIPDGPGFLYTDTAKKIEETLTYAHIAPDMALIYGASGVGKTQMFREYARNNSNVCIATMTPSHSTVSKALQEIGKCVGVRRRPASADLHDELCEALKDRQALLIIDEAQNLGNKALDQIRQIHDKIECGVVFAGNDMVYSNMNGRRAVYLDRVLSRVGMKTRLSKSTTNDAKLLIESWGISDDISVNMLIKIAAKPGALRVVNKVIKLAHMISDTDTVQAKHIRGAWNRLSHEGV